MTKESLATRPKPVSRIDYEDDNDEDDRNAVDDYSDYEKATTTKTGMFADDKM